MKIEIEKSSGIEEYYRIKGCDGLYSSSELLRAVITKIRANFNITDFQLNKDKYI